MLIGSLGATSFSAASVCAYLAGQYGPTAGLSLLIALNIHRMLCAGFFEISAHAIIHTTHFRRYRIARDDVQKIEYSRQATLILHGTHKRFALAPPGWWSGPDKADARSFLLSHIAARGLTTRPGRFADDKTHKNVRVPLHG